MALPTLVDAKAHLNVASSGHDAELFAMLAAAVDVIEGQVGPLEPRSYTETHYNVSGRHPIVLRRTPAIVVTSITAPYGSALNLATVRLDGVGGLLYLPGSWWGGEVTVTYTAGRADLPAAIRLAILIVVGRLWETQRGNAPGARRQEPDDLTLDPSALPLLPPRARELLQPYVLGGVVA